MVAEGGRRGKDWEFGISRSKLLNTGWTNDKILHNNTGSQMQHIVINHYGTEYEKENIYV